MLLLYYCFWGTVVSLVETSGERQLSPERSEIWGPGLKALVVLPVRYFYIQAVDTSGNKFTSSPGEKVFQVKILASHEQFAKVGVQVLDRKDGSFIAIYKMFASYSQLKIIVKFHRRHVARSPYIIEGPVYHENCDCPLEDSKVWLQEMSCPETFPQIQRDLAQFPIIDPDKIATEIPKRFGQRQNLCHYTLKDNKVYIKTYGEDPGFRHFMNPILLSLTRKVGIRDSNQSDASMIFGMMTMVFNRVKMPDLEFFVNLDDWPLGKKKFNSVIYPIFSWCGSTNSSDIVMPNYDLTLSILETMGRTSVDMMSVQGNTGPPWESKKPTAVWRGRDSHKNRLELVKLSRKHPDLIDAAVTSFVFSKHNEDLYGPVGNHIAFYDFFKHKYLINIDGTVAAYRLPYLLIGDSVVLKQDSIYYEHFYNEMQPWKHYIPLKSNLSDIVEKLKWAKGHDEEVKKIAKAGQEFARNNLMSDNVFCYYFRLFQEYANLQVSKPKIRKGMKKLQFQTKNDFFPCTCHRRKIKDEL